MELKFKKELKYKSNEIILFSAFSFVLVLLTFDLLDLIPHPNF